MNEKKPIDLILDTDIGSDSDDVGAMMVLHRLRQAGECNLLAVTSSTSRKDSVAIIDVINRYYGADVPTGNVKGKKCSEGGTHGMYSRAVAFAYGAIHKGGTRKRRYGAAPRACGGKGQGAAGYNRVLCERRGPAEKRRGRNFAAERRGACGTEGFRNVFHGGKLQRRYEFLRLRIRGGMQRAAVFGGQHIRCRKTFRGLSSIRRSNWG